MRYNVVHLVGKFSFFNKFTSMQLDQCDLLKINNAQCTSDSALLELDENRMFVNPRRSDVQVGN